MLTIRRLLVPALCALALVVSFTSGWAVNKSAYYPADCVMVCDEPCPPECIVICDPADCPSECAAICPMDCAGVGSGESISLFDPAGTSPFRLFAGQEAEILK